MATAVATAVATAAPSDTAKPDGSGALWWVATAVATAAPSDGFADPAPSAAARRAGWSRPPPRATPGPREPGHLLASRALSAARRSPARQEMVLGCPAGARCSPGGREQAACPGRKRYRRRAQALGSPTPRPTDIRPRHERMGGSRPSAPGRRGRSPPFTLAPSRRGLVGCTRPAGGRGPGLCSDRPMRTWPESSSPSSSSPVRVLERPPHENMAGVRTRRGRRARAGGAEPRVVRSGGGRPEQWSTGGRHSARRRVGAAGRRDPRGRCLRR